MAAVLALDGRAPQGLAVAHQLVQTLAPAWQTPPDHGSSCSRSGSPVPPPAADTRLETAPHAVSGADQIEIRCGRTALGHEGETIPPTSAHAGAPGQATWHTLLISPGIEPRQAQGLLEVWTHRPSQEALAMCLE